jgi:hypothetical protein
MFTQRPLRKLQCFVMPSVLRAIMCVCIALALRQHTGAHASAHTQDSRVPGLVYDSAVQRNDDGTVLLAVCIANLGPSRVDDVTLGVGVQDIDGASPAVITSLSAASHSMLTTRTAESRIDVLEAGAMQQIDLTLRTDTAPSTGLLRIDVPSAYRLEGAVRLDCQPHAKTATPIVLAQPARLKTGGQPLALREAITQLRSQGLPIPQHTTPAVQAPAASVALLGLLAGCVLLGLLSLGALAMRRIANGA